MQTSVITAVWLAVAPAAAQVTISEVTTLETTGCAAGVQDNNGGWTWQRDELPAGSAVPNGRVFAASVGSGSCAAAGSLQVSWSGAQLDLVASHDLDARGCFSAIADNHGVLRLRFATPQPVAGWFEWPKWQFGISIEPGGWGPRVYPQQRHPLVITDGTIAVVRFRKQGIIDLGSLLRFDSDSDENALRFVAAPTTIETHLPPCGPALAGGLLATGNPFYRAEFEATGAPVTPFSFFVVGGALLDVAIPPTGCRVGTDFLIVVPRTVGADSRARLSFTVASALLSVPVNLQFLAATLEGPVQLWRTSNTLRMLPR